MLLWIVVQPAKYYFLYKQWVSKRSIVTYIALVMKVIRTHRLTVFWIWRLEMACGPTCTDVGKLTRQLLHISQEKNSWTRQKLYDSKWTVNWACQLYSEQCGICYSCSEHLVQVTEKAEQTFPLAAHKITWFQNCDWLWKFLENMELVVQYTLKYTAHLEMHYFSRCVYVLWLLTNVMYTYWSCN